MRREIKTDTGQMVDRSDLTVAAPLRRGLVPSLDAVSYKTRAQRVLQLLQLGRQGQYEFELTRVLADAVERIGMIHSVRVAIIEPQNLVMLSVTFDGAWEPYMRVIWQKVPRLLDLIFCNTEDYVYGWESSYEDWMVWLRRHQVSTPFFYAQAHQSAGDVDLLRRQEWLQRQHPDQEPAARLMAVSNADMVERNLGEGAASDPRFPGSIGYGSSSGGNFLLVRQSVRALAALHRLTDVYMPGTHDGWVLHRAAREALSRLAHLHSTGSIPVQDTLVRFVDALNWLIQNEADAPAARRYPPLQNALTDVLPAAHWPQIQAGILQPLDADHAAVLLLRFDTAVALGDFLCSVPVTHHAGPFDDRGISFNVALSAEGLRLAGFDDDELKQWPDAFREGMPRRAGLLGDVRSNHPRNWLLPRRLPAGVIALTEDPAHTSGADRIEHAEMHVLLQVRLRTGLASTPEAARLLLRAALESCTQAEQRLAVQWMHRQKNAAGQTVEHFGWRDAQTDPVFNKEQASPQAGDHSHLGEALCGYPNAVDHRWPSAAQPCSPWLQGGSFLVVRKLRQDVSQLLAGLALVEPALDADIVRAKLVGRWHDGASQGRAGLPLVRRLPVPAESNDFRFSGDDGGELCPLHAHIRRSNQRRPHPSLSNCPVEGEPRVCPPDSSPQSLVRPPKLFRRSMSYGPRFEPGQEGAERGLFFMAYNASLAEQFEVVQRWLSGANSGGSDTALSDPLLGVATPGQPRTTVFVHEGCLHRVPLEPAAYLNEEPKSLVRLEWGAYWFAPSLPVLARLAERAQASRETALWAADRGEREIQRLLALEAEQGPQVGLQAWKEALEDPESLLDYRAASIWAAVRERHGGHLKCAFGVLVGSPAGVDLVLRDEQRYTATGYMPRMQYSFGPIFLGCDAGAADGRYETESAFIVDAIRALPVDSTYLLARRLTGDKLLALRDMATASAHDNEDRQWRLTFDVRELLDDLLGEFCVRWFGIREGRHFLRGGLDVALGAFDTPRNPGHFASPSRYFFQPHPNAEVARVGEAHGQALRRAMQAVLDEQHPDTLEAPLVQAVLSNPYSAKDPGYAARTLVGVVMGFVPTVDGTLRRILAEWLREGSFWRLRGQSPELATLLAARRFLAADFVRGIQMRAAPELLWRTAASDHLLGVGRYAVPVQAGERVVAGLMSSTQSSWEQGRPEYHHVFGGDRGAASSPTHACPGTQAAEALMLGFFAALMESTLPLRPGPAGLSFEAAGEMPALVMDADREFSDEKSLRLQTVFTTTVDVLALGDSWLIKGSALWFGGSLPYALGKLGYRSDCELSSSGHTMEAIADMAQQAVGELGSVDLVLLDGGGNDVHKRPSIYADPKNPDWPDLPDHSPRRTLDDLLKGKNGLVELHDAIVHDFINVRLRSEMKRALTALTSVSNRRPVIVVAYDYPIPDGSGLAWLEPAFTRVGLDARNPADLAKSTALMRELIRLLNVMVADLVARDFAGRDVYAIPLTGTLATSDWRNELHPNQGGFARLAAKLDGEIRKLPNTVPRPVP